MQGYTPSPTPTIISKGVSPVVVIFLLVMSMLGSGVGSYLGVRLGDLNQNGTQTTPTPTVSVTNTPTTSTTPSPTFVACTSAFTDDFSETAINTDFWTTDTHAGQITIQNSALHITVPAPKADDSATIASKLPLHGDFAIQVDVPSVSVTADKGSAELAIGSDAHVHVSRLHYADGHDIIETNARTSATSNWIKSTTVNVPAGSTTVTLRIVRAGSDVKVFYKTTTAFVQVADYPNLSAADLPFQIYSYSTEKHPTVNTVFDNFALSCPQ